MLRNARYLCDWEVYWEKYALFFRLIPSMPHQTLLNARALGFYSKGETKGA